MDSGTITNASPAVIATFESYREDVKPAVLALRQLIIDTAAETPGVGSIEETLKWGQPAYVTSETRSGSTIRIAQTKAGSPHDYAMYFICHTNLIRDFRAQFDNTFEYDGNRGLLFKVGVTIPTGPLRECIAMALTYHLTKQ